MSVTEWINLRIVQSVSLSFLNSQGLLWSFLSQYCNIDFVDIADARHSSSALGSALAYCNIALH